MNTSTNIFCSLAVWLAIMLPSIGSGQISSVDSLLTILENQGFEKDIVQNINTTIQQSLYQSPADVLNYSTALDSMITDSDDIFSRAETKNSYGLALYVNQRFDEAINQMLESMRLFEQLENQSKIGRLSNSLAIVYQVRKESNTSAKYWEKALSIYKELNDSLWIANVASNLGGHYMEHDSLTKADALFELACPIFESLNQSGLLGYAKLNQGSLRVKQGRFKEAIAAFDKTFEFIPYEANPLIHAVALTGRGNAHLELKDYVNAKKDLLRGYNISQEIQQYEQLKPATELLSRYYEEVGNHKRALTYYKEVTTLQDSFLTAEEDARLVDALEKYETEKKEQEIALLSAENEIKDFSLQKTNRNLIFALLGLMGLASFAFYIFRSRRKLQELNGVLENQKNLISKSLKEKEFLLKEIHHRVKNNLQVISSLLKLQSKSVADEKAQQALNEGRSRVRSMALIHQSLYQDDSNLGGINVQEYIQQLCDELFETYKVENDKITLDVKCDEMTLDVDTVVPIGLIINELVSNSIKYGFPENKKGSIHVVLKEDEANQMVLKVYDTGIGYDASNIPSRTFGLRLVKAFAERLNADYSFNGLQGACSEFVIKDYKIAA